MLSVHNLFQLIIPIILMSEWHIFKSINSTIQVRFIPFSIMNDSYMSYDVIIVAEDFAECRCAEGSHSKTVRRF